MIGIRITAIAVVMLIFCGNASGNELTPREILNRTAAAYRAMETYKAEGTVSSEAESRGTKLRTEISFSILLKKPNLYLISWTEKNGSVPGIDRSGAVWSDGKQPYLFMGMLKAYSRMSSDEVALSSAAGISGGAAITIPSLFLSLFKDQQQPFSRLKDVRIEKIEKMGQEECYVLTGSSAIAKKESFWITKNGYLIMKYYRSLDPAEGGRQLPVITDQQLDEAIKAMGQEVTEQSRKSMRETMEKMGSRLISADLKGGSAERYEKISFPGLNPDEFKFAVPEGAALRDSLLNDMVEGRKDIPLKDIDHDGQ